MVQGKNLVLGEMKKTGSFSDFTAQRDRELHAAFIDELRNTQGVPLRDMFARAALHPASRFWVSETRCAEVISKMLRGEEDLSEMNTKKQEMYRELYTRVRAILEKYPERTVTDAVCEAVNSRAPEFYLTPLSARVIIYRIRRR